LPLSPKGGPCSHSDSDKAFMFTILLIKELNDEVSDTTDGHKNYYCWLHHYSTLVCLRTIFNVVPLPTPLSGWGQLQLRNNLLLILILLAHQGQTINSYSVGPDRWRLLINYQQQNEQPVFHLLFPIE
jgi:hypothetical protein